LGESESSIMTGWKLWVDFDEGGAAEVTGVKR
jgi:hypothetical protein